MSIKRGIKLVVPTSEGRTYPNTEPSPDDLRNLTPGDYVKLLHSGRAVWVSLTEKRPDDLYVGTVESILYDEYCKRGDSALFASRHIVTILTRADYETQVTV